MKIPVFLHWKSRRFFQSWFHEKVFNDKLIYKYESSLEVICQRVVVLADDSLPPSIYLAFIDILTTIGTRYISVPQK